MPVAKRLSSPDSLSVQEAGSGRRSAFGCHTRRSRLHAYDNPTLRHVWDTVYYETSQKNVAQRGRNNCVAFCVARRYIRITAYEATGWGSGSIELRKLRRDWSSPIPTPALRLATALEVASTAANSAWERVNLAEWTPKFPSEASHCSTENSILGFKAPRAARFWRRVEPELPSRTCAASRKMMRASALKREPQPCPGRSASTSV